ncbi:nucleotidyltransferase domain-containing protein [Brevundimonas sp. MEB006b]|uniref:type VII toxin-antitoxin system MntA family adenylyltransferase antitoxin n=1 Tax=Brevundimonas sp. MEB006b TaxID=3040283 RepID=UPI00254C9EF4|nr:nucleotidyltransferase domain-containing protein [Brevundimonas sp. MEB006b]
MIREEVIVILRSLQAALQAQGISHLYLFGSFARGEAGPKSDIDLAFEVAEEMDLKFSLLDQARIGRELGEALATKVDFVELPSLRPHIAKEVARDLIVIF